MHGQSRERQGGVQENYRAFSRTRQSRERQGEGMHWLFCFQFKHKHIP
jgi:hypothetical protein